MNILAATQGYKSFIVNAVAAVANILILFNVDVPAEDQEVIAQHLTVVAAALFALQGLVATVMRLLTKTPPGKDVNDVRESVAEAIKTDTDDILGDPDET